MGSDDLFKKRKAKKAHELARRKAKRAPYPRVLIVCEGEKTEPNYFEELKDYYGLNSANIEICGPECGSDPLSIVGYAQRKYREAIKECNPFDRVYCVFDKDTHAGYAEAIDIIRRSSPKDTFFAICSVPCFEYWLLLHFIYTTSPYDGMHGDSAANRVIRNLRDYIPDYEKGASGMFKRLIESLEFAKNNAQRGKEYVDSAHTDNPSTDIHKLVDFLQHLKDSS